MKHMKKIFLKNLYPMLFVMLVMISIPVITMNLVHQYSQKECFVTLEENTDFTVSEFVKAVDGNRERVETIARILEKYDDMQSDEVRSIICSFKGYGMMKNLALFLPDGSIYLCNGGIVKSQAAEGFEEEAAKGAYISDVLDNPVSEGERMFVQSVPVMHGDETVAILYGIVKLQDLSEEYTLTVFDGESELFIADGTTGDLILDTWHENGDNLYQMDRRIPKAGYTDEKFLNDFATGQQGTMITKDVTQKEYLYIYYEPVGINNWMIMLSVPEHVVYEKTRRLSTLFNALTLLEVLLVIGLLLAVSHSRMQNVKAIEKMASTDLLTGLLNRNSYQNALKAYEEQKEGYFACIYMDVNGLHELNNTLGHQGGDDMLKTVAEIFSRIFGSEHTYRVGGDEFVAFCFDEAEELVESKTDSMQKEIESNGYFVSVGVEYSNHCVDIKRVVSEAEKQMYEAKRAFYSKNGNAGTMREMNRKLEEILIKKKDADTFLSVISSYFTGVYIINLETEELRSIYIPPYFEELFRKTDRHFLKAFCLYIDSYVQEEDREKLYKLTDMNWLEKYFAEQEVYVTSYFRTDGTELVLRIYDTMDSADDSCETIWLFEKRVRAMGSGDCENCKWRKDL